jgi:hypothetical protein
MENKLMPRWIWWCVGIILFLLFFNHSSLASLDKIFWEDEIAGLIQGYVYYYRTLIIHGAPIEASASPLPTLIIRAWLQLWNFEPQRYWDLRLFFRINSIFYWTVTSVGIFIFSRQYLRKIFTNISDWALLLICLAITSFVHSNDFASHYAIEARTQSMWLALSVAQIFYMLALLNKEQLSKRDWILFGSFSVFFTLVTFASLGQTAIVLAVLWYKSGYRYFRQSAIIVGLCGLIALYYATRAPKLTFGYLETSWFFKSLLEVVSKTFHNHGWESTAAIAPIIFILGPIYYWRSPRARNIYLAGALFYLLGVALFLLCRWKHSMFAARYLIYLTPISIVLYGMALWACFDLLSKGINRINPLSRSQAKWKIQPMYFLILWACIEIVGRYPRYLTEALRAPQIYRERNVFGLSTNPNCPVPLDYKTHKTLEDANQVCRTRYADLTR